MLKIGSKVVILKYWTGCKGFVIRRYEAGDRAVLITEGRFVRGVGCFSPTELRGIPGGVSADQLKALCSILGVDP